MGSSGMKKKGRQHLPKAGTKADEQWLRKEGTKHMEHPFSDDPTAVHGGWAHAAAVIVVAVLVLAMIGWFFITA